MENIIKSEVEIYKMDSNELTVWNQFSDSILNACETMKLNKDYKPLILKRLEGRLNYVHNIGFSSNYGYYFLYYGDRGESFLKLVTKSKEEARLYFLTKILVEVGQKVELQKRSDLLNEWHYDRGKVVNNKFEIVEISAEWKYDDIYDSRLFWFTFVIQKLSVIIEDIYLYPIVGDYLFSMNYWYSKPKWGFDHLNLEFYELNNQQEQNERMKTIVFKDIWVKHDALFIEYLKVLYELFEKCQVSFWSEKISEIISEYKETGNIDNFLSLYGAMGSVNDIWICKVNKHNIQSGGEVWVNELLTNLLGILYNLSKKIKQGEEINSDEIRKSSKHVDKYIQGQCCLQCGYKKISRRNLDTYIASATIFELLNLAVHTNTTNEFIENCISGDFYWIDKKRKDLLIIIKNSNIHYFDNANRVCINCGNREMTVYRWINLNARLINVDDNLPLKTIKARLNKLFESIRK